MWLPKAYQLPARNPPAAKHCQKPHVGNPNHLPETLQLHIFKMGKERHKLVTQGSFSQPFWESLEPCCQICSLFPLYSLYSSNLQPLALQNPMLLPLCLFLLGIYLLQSQPLASGVLHLFLKPFFKRDSLKPHLLLVQDSPATSQNRKPEKSGSDLVSPLPCGCRTWSRKQSTKPGETCSRHCSHQTVADSQKRLGIDKGCSSQHQTHWGKRHLSHKIC